VHALLGAEEAVGVLAGRAEGGRLDARLLPRRRFEHLDLHAAPLGPAHEHAQHHLRPILGIGAARAGVDGDERVARVVAPGEQPLLLELGEVLLDGGHLAGDLVGERVVLLGHLGERLEIVDVGLQGAPALEAPRRPRVLGADLRGDLLVVPEPRLLHLLLELADALGDGVVVETRAQDVPLPAYRLQALGNRERVGCTGHGRCPS
jgi:hypothetical protein